MSQTVVITGASGFIGGALKNTLQKAGHDVIGLSRQKKVINSGLVQVSDYLSYEPPEDSILVHLAESRDVRAAERGGEGYIAKTMALCRGLLEKTWNHVIYASSAEVYGDRITTERFTDEPVVPRGLYAITKHACEKEVLKRRGTVLRLGNIYGDGMSKYNVFSDILKQIPGDGPVWVRDTHPMRDFIWINDAVAAFTTAINLKKDGLFNVGTGHGASIGELARQMLEIAGEGNRPVKSKQSASPGSCIVLDISESKRQLGWTPSITLKKGLQMLIKAHHG